MVFAELFHMCWLVDRFL